MHHADDGRDVAVPGLPSHLRCHDETYGAGRTVTTRVHLRKGSVVFEEIPFAHTVHYSARSRTCDACFAQCDEDEVLDFDCGCGCGVHYCTVECRSASLARHRSACGLIQQTNLQRNATLMSQSLGLLIALSSNPHPLMGVMGMMPDSTVKGARDVAKAESKFRSLRHADAGSLEGPGAYAAALSVKRLNAIGLYDAYGDEVAFALCPALAMVNHSCLPNCQQITEGGYCRLRALRDILPGEELTYSYMSLEGTEMERKEAIRETWDFTCRCSRCRGGDCQAFDAEHVCFCGAVCFEVDRRQCECVCNRPTVCKAVSPPGR